MNSFLKDSINYDDDITLVIPTVGESSLAETVKSVMNSSTVPHKILLCIPYQLYESILYLSNEYKCIEVVPTDQQGQVIQRIFGFKKCITKYTLQLDSDVIVDRFLVANLKRFIENNPETSVGPVIYRANNNTEHSFLSPSCNLFKGYQKKIITRILNGPDGYQSGVISKGGVAFGPDTRGDDSEVEWLPGCCIMHETKNLILDKFYFGRGKAYAEDLYHSHYIKKKRTTLAFDKDSKLIVVFPKGRLSDISGNVKEQYLAFKAGIQFVRLANKSSIRFILYSVLKVFFLVRNQLR